MKKLGKLSINLEKVIKNEELVNLKGGYAEYACTCTCFSEIGMNELGYVFADDGRCHAVCSDFYGPGITGTCGSL